MNPARLPCPRWSDPWDIRGIERCIHAIGQGPRIRIGDADTVHFPQV